MPLLFHMSYDALGFLLQNLFRVPEDLTNVLVGTHCVVEYDGLSYQRLILDVDYNMVEISVVRRIGVKRFIWYRPYMTSAVYCGRTALNQINKSFFWLPYVDEFCSQRSNSSHCN